MTLETDRTGRVSGAAQATAVDHDATDRLARLFEERHQRLYRLAVRVAFDPEDARDLVQETFLRAARALDSVPHGAPHEEAWLVRTLVNLSRDGARRRRVRQLGQQAVKDVEACRTSGSSSSESALIAQAAVRAALAKLAPRRRAIVVLHELEERDVAEIAALLGISKVTVRWHLALGRSELRELLR